MANKAKPEITIDIGCKQRSLLLDLNAMATFEKITGKSFFSGIKADNMGAQELRALLYVCLQHEDRELTLEQVGAWVTLDNMNETARQVTKAIEVALPEPEEVAEEADPLAVITE